MTILVISSLTSASFAKESKKSEPASRSLQENNHTGRIKEIHMERAIQARMMAAKNENKINLKKIGMAENINTAPAPADASSVWKELEDSVSTDSDL